jgi:hypothetical protein
VLLACAWLSGCAHLAARPSGDAQPLAGNWVLDPAHSDDFNALLDHYLGEHRRKLRERTRSMETAGARDPREVPALTMYSPEEPGRERARMAEDLQLPDTLAVALADSGISIRGGSEPVRHFVPGEKVTRIDVSGTAIVACGWEAQAFVISARYVNKAQRNWRYELDRASGELRVDFAGHDPEYGDLTLHARYRRAS